MPGLFRISILPKKTIVVSLSLYVYISTFCLSLISLFRLMKNRDLFENFRLLKFSYVDSTMSNSSIEPQPQRYNFHTNLDYVTYYRKKNFCQASCIFGPCLGLYSLPARLPTFYVFLSPLLS